MKLWRKLLAAVTAGTICLGSIGAMLSVSAETELDSSSISENIALIGMNVMGGIHLWFIMMAMEHTLCLAMLELANMQLTMDMFRMKEMKRMVLFGLETIRPQ